MFKLICNNINRLDTNNKKNFYISIIWFIISLVLVIFMPQLTTTKFEMPKGTLNPTVFPLALSVLNLIFSGYLLITSILNKEIGYESELTESESVNHFRVIILAISIFIYVNIINWFGFLLSSILILWFTLILFTNQKYFRKILTLLILSIFLGLTINYVFSSLLLVSFPEGEIFYWFIK